jgi:hypothetical protein
MPGLGSSAAYAAMPAKCSTLFEFGEFARARKSIALHCLGACTTRQPQKSST